MKPKRDMISFPKCSPASSPGNEKPDGLYYVFKADRPMPFVARWREADGAQRSQAFKTQKERDEFGEVWGKHREQSGNRSPIVLTDEVSKWETFAKLTNGADPIEVARFWLLHNAEQAKSLSLSEAIRNFLALRENARRSEDAASHLKLHLSRFADGVGNVQLSTITADQIRTWLSKLKDPKTGHKLEPVTLRHHLRTVKFFFSVATKEGWLRRSPTESIETPKLEGGEIHVLSVDDAEKLFSVNRNALCIGRLALEAFGGLRYSSAARIEGHEILTGDKAIVMAKQKHKSGRRHYVDGYPENLWAWIKHAPAEGWKVSARNYLDFKAEYFARAGVTNPGNVLRHSFCTYHVALHKDAARTAVLLTHRGPGMLYQHYRGRGSFEDAKRYFSILP